MPSRRLFCLPILLFLNTLLTCPASVLAASSTTAKAPVATLDPCTAHSTLTGSNFDLRPLTLRNVTVKSQVGTNESYHSFGYDYGYNFTLNICAPVMEAVNFTDVRDIKKPSWQNISAYYTTGKDDTVYSLGLANAIPTVRGRKVLLNYTGGSYCPDLDEEGRPLSSLSTRALLDDDDDDDDYDRPNKNGSSKTPAKAARRRKNTFISFVCDTSPSLLTHPRVSFLGTPDECTYMFEVRSRWACAGSTATTNQKGTVGPAGVFVLIAVISLAAYLVGGIVYQRNVMHQRGWKQLPNHSLWSGIWSFISVRRSSLQRGRCND